MLFRSITVSTTGAIGANAGSIGVNLTSATGIADAATNTLSTATLTGQTYTYDTTVPTVTVALAAASDTGSSSSDGITSAATLTYNVTFSESVTGLATGDFSLSGTSCTLGVLSGSGTTYTLTVTSCADGASVGLSVLANAVSDAAGNSGPAATTAAATVTIDRTGPTVTINQAATQADPANASPVLFRVVFSEPINVSSFTAADVTIGGTATGTKTVTLTEVAPNDGTTFQASVSSITSTAQTGGTVIASIAVGLVSDPAGNTSAASTSTDNTVTYDTVRPTLTSINRSTGATNPTNTGPLTWTATFVEPVSGVTASNFGVATSGITGTAPSITSVATTDEIGRAHV